MATQIDRRGPELEAFNEARRKRKESFIKRPATVVGQELHELAAEGQGMVIINPETKAAIRVTAVNIYPPNENMSHYKYFFHEVNGKPVEHTVEIGDAVAPGFWNFPKNTQLFFLSAQGENGEEGAIVEIAEANAAAETTDPLGNSQYVDLEPLTPKRTIPEHLGMVKYDPKAPAEERVTYGLEFIDTTSNVIQLVRRSNMPMAEGVPQDLPTEPSQEDSDRYLGQFADPAGGM